ncbi:hypothetical protein AURDEDRAFT_151052 [Auricularia subglabra TFB-10046 SS5]|nr:hypothetical protein AURDEDRAFT_151052 [Auricularia subglabra TFB-10046 SS5]
MKVEETFAQSPPPEVNPFTSDLVLPPLLKRLLPQSAFSDVSDDLSRFGAEIVSIVRSIGPLVQEPTLTQYDHWGRRVDLLQTSEGWRMLRDFTVREGVVALAYQRRHGPYSRVHALAKAMLMVGDTHTILCPFAMTDGSARALELYGTPEMKRDYLTKLISFDPKVAYTSGQWMTEKTGGSDVAGTETTAAPATAGGARDVGPAYTLNGFKWFSSAAEGNMALALGRTEDPSTKPGSRGLSLFLIPLRTPEYPRPLDNGVRIHRLKSKFGTKALPTAELSLDSTRGFLLGERAHGVRCIAPLLNITRVYSAVTSVGCLQRALSFPVNYAGLRTIAGGKQTLRDTPLYVSGLATAALTYRALAHFAMHVVLLLGKTECGVASEGEAATLRLLTPVAKAFAAERAAPQIQACMQAMGGQGYMEETGLARLVRDQLVETIWEGTSAVLAHDVMRASSGRDKPVQRFVEWAQNILRAAPTSSADAAAVHKLQETISGLPSLFVKAQTNPLLPKAILDTLGHVAAGVLLLEHAAWSRAENREESAADAEAFRRWTLEEGPRDVGALGAANVEARMRLDAALAFGQQPGTAKL